MPNRLNPSLPGMVGYDTSGGAWQAPLGGDYANGPAGLNRMGQLMPGLPQAQGMFRMPANPNPDAMTIDESGQNELLRQQLAALLRGGV